MTVLLIALNVAVFLYEILLPDSLATEFVTKFALIPKHVNPQHAHHTSQIISALPSLFTAMFLHGGFLHLIGNMLYLWIFGDNVEERMGSLHFLAFYLACGLIATFAQVYTNPASMIPILGASGAIAGVLGAYIRLFPKARIAVLVPIFFFLRTIILPAWLVLGMWILLQVAEVQTMASHVKGDMGGIAYFAHLGGFVAGFFLMPLFTQKKRR